MTASQFRRSFFPIILGNGAMLIFALLGPYIWQGSLPPGIWVPIYCLLIGYLLTMQFFFSRWSVQPVATYNFFVLIAFMEMDQENSLQSAGALWFIFAAAAFYLVSPLIRGKAWGWYLAGLFCLQIAALVWTLSVSSLLGPLGMTFAFSLGLVPLTATLMYFKRHGNEFDAALLPEVGAN